MWEAGRQGTGYLKWKVFAFKRFDCWLLKYEDGTGIPPHIDEVPSGNMYRLNVVLKKPQSGGNFVCKKAIVFGRFALFNASKQKHWCSVVKGERLVLSIGIWIW